ncbi:putative papain-like cysteine peptidase superfamily [Helianthus annuus]|nr:putative papain-like cysteine peptidase superfamily [Helianthus annuus]
MASTANVDLRFTSKKSSRNYREDEVGDTVRGSKSQEVEVEIAKKHISGNSKKSFCTSKANSFVRRGTLSGAAVKRKREVLQADCGDADDNDDVDFVNPAASKVKKPVDDTLPKKRRRKDQPEESNHHECQMFFPYTGEKILPRCSPKTLYEWMLKFNDKQKNIVRDIGFGSILNLKIQHVPTSLGLWLAKNYDDSTRILNLGSQSIKLSPELVHSVLGIPNGSRIITENNRPSIKSPVVKLWRSQFPTGFTRFLVHETQTYLDRRCKRERNDCGMLFVLNFLVLMFTHLGEGTKSGTVNQRFLPLITKDVDIKELGWCDYMLTLLDRARKGWHPAQVFNGPLFLLALIYADHTSKLHDVHVKHKGLFVIEHIEERTLSKLEDIKNKGLKSEKRRKKGTSKSKTVLKTQKSNESEVRQRSSTGEPVHEKVERQVDADEGKDNDGAGVEEDLIHEDIHGEDERQVDDDECRDNDRYTRNIYLNRRDENADVGRESNIPVAEEPTEEAESVIKEAKAHLDPLISFAKNAGFMSRDPDSSPKDDNEIQSKGEKKTQSQETKSDCNTGVNVNSVENIISDEKDEENVVDSTDETLVPASPYINRVVELSEKLTFVEEIYSDWIFSARGFEMYPDSGQTRIVLETLSHDEYVHFAVANVWARILNHEEKFKADDKIKRLFCTYQMLDGGTYGSSYEMMQAEFFGNMIKVLKEEQVASLKEVDLLFIPVLQSDHFYLVCFHMKKCQIAVIDNSSLYDDSFDLKYRGWPEKLVHSLTFKKHNHMEKIICLYLLLLYCRSI